MPSQEQVIFHNQQAQQMEQARREEEARQQAAQSAQQNEYQRAAQEQQVRAQRERDAALAGYQGQQQMAGYEAQRQRDYNLADYGQQAAAQQHQQQSQLMTQQAGHQEATDYRRADIQSQLQQITLTQNEEMRLGRMRNAIADVRANPNLAPDERDNLITQLQTGLNPLEDRQRQANILHSQVQSQAQVQQTQQQATLFSQHQAYIARGAQASMQVVTDPRTGETQLFQVDHRGQMTPMDFSQANELHNLRMTQGAVGVAGQIQGIQQGQQLFPEQLRHAQLGNQQTTQNMQFQAARQPGELRALDLANMTSEQRYNFAQQANPRQLQTMDLDFARNSQELEHNTALSPIQIEQGRAHLAETQRATWQAALEGPGRIAHQEAITNGLVRENAFNARMEPARVAEYTARLEALKLANERHRTMLPGEIRLQNANIDRILQDLQQHGRANPLQLQLLEAHLNHANRANESGMSQHDLQTTQTRATAEVDRRLAATGPNRLEYPATVTTEADRTAFRARHIAEEAARMIQAVGQGNPNAPPGGPQLQGLRVTLNSDAFRNSSYGSGGRMEHLMDYVNRAQEVLDSNGGTYANLTAAQKENYHRLLNYVIPTVQRHNLRRGSGGGVAGLNQAIGALEGARPPAPVVQPPVAVEPLGGAGGRGPGGGGNIVGAGGLVR